MHTFRARARTVDMLGRQQIVGVPTAVSELFKNAYDAYARRAEVDFFRKSETFLLRDDGTGMTLEDVERRWLVLGTESKTEKLGGEGGEAPVPPPEGFAKRPILGEKGIGRLAISTIGPVTLMVTRAKRAGVLHAPVAVLIAWELFEVPGVDLDCIDIPVRVLEPGTLPSLAVVRSMVEDVQACIKRLRESHDSPRYASVEKQLTEMSAVDPSLLIERAGGMTLRGEGHGTFFLVRPVSPLLVGDLDEDERTGISPVVKTLGGFVNEFTPGVASIDFAVAFRDHPADGAAARERIASREFFGPEDFAEADHSLVGEFDEQGVFRGRLRIYGGKAIAVEHTPRAERRRGRVASPGTFRFSFAYVQGRPVQSELARRDPERWERFSSRLDELGGIYLYRDGVRIQPYGGPANDWLDVEKRRTKSASYYFFSYRRMIGAVELTRERNPRLHEKAGREGFQENAEYRRMQGLVSDLLVHLATQYFREDSPDTRWRSAREDLERSEETRKRVEAVNRERRKAFTEAVETALTQLEGTNAESSVRAVAERYESKLREVAQSGEGDLFTIVEEAQRKAISELDSARDRLRVTKPPGVGLTHSQQREWSAYQEQFQRFVSDVVARERTQLDAITERVLGEVHAEVDRRKLARAAAEEAAKKSRARVRAARTELDEALASLQGEVSRLSRNTVSEFDREVDAQNVRVESLLENTRTEVSTMEVSLDGAARSSAERLEAVRDALRGITKQIREGGRAASAAETVAALEEELIALREKDDANAGLLQIGMAIEVIEHELHHNVRSIREGITSLQPWADRNQGLLPIYSKLRTSFTHLDGYLSLFTPFHRRLQRSAVTFHGADLHKYLTNLFKARLAEREIALTQSDAFRDRAITGYPSTFYPVFVNLVDNATFWLQDRKPPRRIELDAVGDALVVRDNGPGVPKRYREAIFEAGFSRKPGGRGLGLHISREVLRREGWTLSYDDVRGGGAQFSMRATGGAT